MRFYDQKDRKVKFWIGPTDPYKFQTCMKCKLTMVQISRKILVTSQDILQCAAYQRFVTMIEN